MSGGIRNEDDLSYLAKIQAEDEVRELQKSKTYKGVLPFTMAYGHGDSKEYSVPDYEKLAADQLRGPEEVRPKLALRYNDSKVPLNLLAPDAEEEEAKVWMCGFRKYPAVGKHDDGRTIQNWEVLWGDDTLDVVLGCAMRHLAAIRRGELFEVQKDKEGNIMRWPDGTPVVTHHAASVRTNMAMLIRYAEQSMVEQKQKLIEENRP